MTCHHNLKYVDGIFLTNEQQTLPDFVDTSAKQSERGTAMIRSVIALYALDIDSKNFQSLEYVFMPDVMVKMSMVRPIIQGLSLLQSILRDDFDGLLTTHQLDNADLRIIKKNCQALTITYITTTIMSTSESSRKVCCNSFTPPPLYLSFDISVLVLMVGFVTYNRW